MKILWRFLTSIRLTLFLLGASTALIFFGTLDQVHDGIYLTQQRYFEHVFVVWAYSPELPLGAILQWIRLPLPGGYLLGPLLVVNLVCAHFRYYRFGVRKLGIAALHLGVVVLLIGQLITQVAQEDNFMWLSEGESSNYLESFHDNELVVIDKTHPGHDQVVSWPVAAFSRGQTELRHPTLPFTVKVVGYQLNAAIFPRDRAPEAPSQGINRGIGASRNFAVQGIPPTYADGERNRTTAIVDLVAPDEDLGRWLVSNVFRQTAPVSLPTEPQTFTYQDRTYEIALRFRRSYLPASVRLVDFTHERYPGTEIPFNFSSEVILESPDSSQERSTLIYMNHPLRFAGYTFYQASFANNDTMSMFQVVRNPGRLVPYVACTIITLGMLYQFSFSLVFFALRRRRATPSAS